MKAKAVKARLRKRELHEPATSLICLENANSQGRSIPLANMNEVRALADEWKLPLHLDGARIFNAAVSLGIDAKDIAARADSVMFCLSKGLCAPVGSLLAGSAAFVKEARMKRKIMGGGMRQAGILAAAGILALTEQTQCLAEDHERARKIARELAEIPGVTVNPWRVDINMIFVVYPAAADPERAARIADCFKQRGILINAPENGLFRFVTHYGIDDKDADTIIAVCREVFSGTI
jgi:threonine aldolase